MTGIRYWTRIILCVLILILTIWVAAKAQNNGTERLQLHADKALFNDTGNYIGRLQGYCDTGNGAMIYITLWGSNRSVAAIPNGCTKR